jgi:hypothetical protein
MEISMEDQSKNEEPSRIAHYFRDVDLASNSSPGFVPEHFSGNCWAEEDWPGLFLLRVAIRFHHIWATFGIRNGQATIHGTQPAVCFSKFRVADLIAARDKMPGTDRVVTQYAVTFPTSSAERAGAAHVLQGVDLRTLLQQGRSAGAVTQEEVWQNQFRHVDGQIDMFGTQGPSAEWRWRYPRNYRRAIDKIQREGRVRGRLPGLDLTGKKWSGIGVTVATHTDALRVQYDILTLIDQGLVSVDHFDHLLVCERLPPSLEGLFDGDLDAAAKAACFDFKACLAVSDEAAAVTLADFSARVSALEVSTPKKETHERGGCWVYLQDNSHPYVRALLKAGRVVVNQQGRYLATLDELGRGRDLRERQNMVKVLCKQLEQEHGVACSYFSVLNSWQPDDSPSFCGRLWSRLYQITSEPEEDEEDD